MSGGEHLRHDMHRWFAEALERQEAPWRLVRGPRDERVAQALRNLAETGITAAVPGRPA